jgi:hypothetical protein
MASAGAFQVLSASDAYDVYVAAVKRLGVLWQRDEALLFAPRTSAGLTPARG